jgi:hypothetical protein
MGRFDHVSDEQLELIAEAGYRAARDYTLTFPDDRDRGWTPARPGHTYGDLNMWGGYWKPWEEMSYNERGSARGQALYALIGECTDPRLSPDHPDYLPPYDGSFAQESLNRTRLFWDAARAEALRLGVELRPERQGVLVSQVPPQLSISP